MYSDFPGFGTWTDPESKVHRANMGPTWVLSALDGPHVGPMNLAIRGLKDPHMMTSSNGNIFRVTGHSPVPGEFPAQRPVTRNFDVFLDLCLNKRLSKHSWGWRFETLSRPLWHHCNDIWLNATPTLKNHANPHSHGCYEPMDHMDPLETHNHNISKHRKPKHETWCYIFNPDRRHDVNRLTY